MILPIYRRSTITYASLAQSSPPSYVSHRAPHNLQAKLRTLSLKIAFRELELPMGQDFQLVAPRAKLALPWRGNLGEILFDGSAARELVYLLAVPVPPQRPPEATLSAPAQTRNEFAAQRTAIDVVQDLRETTRLKRKANDQVFVDSPSCKQAKTKDGGDGTTTMGNPVTLSDLPSEVHRLIFAQLEDVVDAISLGATNWYFWTFGRERIYQYAMSFFGRWAGHNIVCVGEDVEPDDYPPGLFSAEEQDEFRQRMGPEGDPDDSWPNDFSDQPFTLHHFTHPSVSKMEEVSNLYGKFTMLRGELSLYRDAIKDASYSAIIGSDLWAAGNEKAYLPEDQQWILRNLTTRQLVRSEAIALKPEFIRGPFVRGLGFAEVLLTRICWSTSDYVGMVDTTRISRGVWAGHCFDITTRTRHEDEVKLDGERWDDVSDEVAQEMMGIWGSQDDPNWRENL
ncbi:uncharacterized protein UV8b_05301 [Ustilaginoidea virens]|uniref:F-box domain-containing protein n=2 Tax=Ustilaginoidea virens TaxID=1159556 RepID=A0A8E5HT49_USTVR|nr:uncharacterized protein UV8b_05301 [Ustilaginoidea virens]QUC21058.1 hypothetical protein UV8b_05301 [Ustilaginoidea virens]